MELPGLPRMTLSGVIYHNGRTALTGHYTCVCRGPGGRFWSFDDTSVRPLGVDVSTHKRTQVALAVYVRAGGEPWFRPVGGRAPDASAGPSGSAIESNSVAMPNKAGDTPRRFRKKGQAVLSPLASGRGRRGQRFRALACARQGKSMQMAAEDILVESFGGRRARRGLPSLVETKHTCDDGKPAPT